MKKSYLMIAAALLAACAGNDTVNDIETTETAISFDSFSSNVTKGAIEGNDLTARKKSLSDEGGFVVYGYKTLTNLDNSTWSAIDQTIFNGINVYSDNNGSTWKYDRLRFWDKNGKYNFYAVAPYDPEDNATYSIVSTIGNDFGKITIAGATSKISSESDDYLIARTGALNELGSNHTNSNNPTVNFAFHHVMAKVTFALKSTLSTGKIQVTSLEMSGWNNANGTFAQNTFVNPTLIECSEWTLATPAVAGNAVLVGTGGDAAIDLTCATNATATDLDTWYIMVPQAISANTLKFKLTFTYTDDNGTANDTSDDYTETFTDQEATVELAQTWGTDSYTKYTIDVKPAEIKFDITSICNFDNNGGEKEVPLD